MSSTRWLPVRRIAEVINGGTPGPNDEYWNGDIPWATPIDLGKQHGGSISSTDRCLTYAGVSSGSTQVPAGSVLISSRAPIGYVAVAETSISFNQGCKALRLLAATDDPRFLSYAIQATTQSLISAGRGSTFLEVNSSDLSSHSIPWTDSRNASATADFLDRETTEIDKLASDLDSALHLRRERLQSTIDRAILTSDHDPIRLKRFGISIKAGVSVNASTYAAEEGRPGVLKTGAVSKGYFDPTENKAVEDPHEITRLSTPVLKGAIIVNRANTPDLVGSAVLVDQTVDDLYLSDLLWQVHVERADPAYVAAYMQTRAYRDSIDLIRVGSSASMQKISQENFANILVPALPLAEQRAIADEVSRARHEFLEAADDINSAITLAKERRAALITAAVTGQIDVTAKRRPAAEQLEDDIKELS